MFYLCLFIVVSYISRVPQTVGAQWIRDLKVETDSGIGGKIFRARWKENHGRVETFSEKGGNFFMVRWKDFQGKVERKSCHFFLRRKEFQGR